MMNNCLNCQIKTKNKKFCTLRCALLFRNFRGTPRERFEGKIKNISGNTCWLWGGAKDRNGYARMHYNGRNEMAYRVAYILFKGPIPENKEVCHTCDNGFCVNPNHLWLGTHKENMEDMSKKKRGSKIKGEDVGISKLTEKEVLEIRAKYKPCKGDIRSHKSQNCYSTRKLMKEYGISRSAIQSVVYGNTWKHLM